MALYQRYVKIIGLVLMLGAMQPIQSMQFITPDTCPAYDGYTSVYKSILTALFLFGGLVVNRLIFQKPDYIIADITDAKHSSL